MRAQEPPLPGSIPGTERWIVVLGDRGYDLAAALQAIQQETDEQNRAGLVGQLEQLAEADQAEIAGLAVATGGAVVRHYWILSALAVEVPPAALPDLEAHARVHKLVPDVARFPADTIGFAPATALPIGASTDVNNHNVAAARALITSVTSNTPASLGDGVTVAVFDTGIDEDADGATSSVQDHPCFLKPGPSPTTRIRAHLRAGVSTESPPGVIDVNNIFTYPGGTTGGFGPLQPTATYGYQPNAHSTSALHGTAMAAIAAGNSAAGFSYDGHAPRAELVDVSVTVLPPAEQPPSPFTAANRYRNRWATDVASLLNAIQMLRSNIYNTQQRVDVVNISFDGVSDPDHPLNVAFDEMAAAHDLLLVTSCGNAADETWFSNGFHVGISVGSVRTRASVTAPFSAMPETSRGPLVGTKRFYPDVCATGAGTWPATPPNHEMQMPMADILDWRALVGSTNQGNPFGTPVPQGSIRFARGTSEACAQVSGAALLYRATAPAVGRYATAEETRAAILLNTIGAAPGDYSGAGTGTGQDQDAFSSRNTFGVGYVRDDLLVEFGLALGNPTFSQTNNVNALAQVVALPASGGVWSTSVTYTGLVPGQRYAVVACWGRTMLTPPPDLTTVPLPNVDLRIWDTVTQPPVQMAHSISPANSYERLVFVATQTTAEIEVLIPGPSQGWVPFPIQIVARAFEPDRDPVAPGQQPMPVHAGSGYYESEDNGPNCLSGSRSLEPERVLPAAYADAYGSKFSGFALAPHSGSLSPWGNGIHVVYAAAEVGDSMDIGGLAFRSGRPFQSGSPLNLVSARLGESAAAPVDAAQLAMGPQNGGILNGATMTPVASQVWGAGNPDWVPRGYDEFPIVVPFTNAFSYTEGRNLHLWLDWSGDLEVQGVSDGSPSPYGHAYAHNGPSPSYTVRIGECPVLALLPAQSSPPAQLPPRLAIFGEPLIGTTLELQVRQAELPTLQTPLGAGVFLVWGTWQPFAPPSGQTTCHEHLVAPFYSDMKFANGAGFTRWSLPIPNAAILVHSVDLEWQGVIFGTSILTTNGIRATIGGGL